MTPGCANDPVAAPQQQPTESSCKRPAAPPTTCWMCSRNPHQIAIWHEAVRGNTPAWNVFFNSYEAAVDLPASAFWRELAAADPQALIILSVRDTPEQWWESVSATILDPSRPLPAPGTQMGPGTSQPTGPGSAAPCSNCSVSTASRPGRRSSHTAWKIAQQIRDTWGRRLLYARTRSPVLLLPTSPDARGPFIRSERGD
jgi:hypothetical protein